MPPTYRQRLRLEGLTMAACGAVGSVALIVLEPDSRQRALSTGLQLAAVAVLLERLGRRSVKRYMENSVEVEPGGEGTGEPTPLWQLPVIMVGLGGAFVLVPQTGLPASGAAGWDAGLRITAGCLLVGLAQGVLYERIVAADERARGRRYFRAPGSMLLRGTQLAHTRDAD
jgi:hypothetical protein